MTDEEEEERERADDSTSERRERRDQPERQYLSEDSHVSDKDNPSTSEEHESLEATIHLENDQQIFIPQIEVDQISLVEAEEQADRPPNESTTTIAVPQVDTGSSTFVEAEELNEGLIDEATRTVTVPQFESHSLIWLDSATLEEGPVEIDSNVGEVSIPQIQPDQTKRIKPYDGLIATTEDESSAERHRWRQEEKTVDSAESGSFESEIEDIPDILELLLGSGNSSIVSDGPIVVWVKHDRMVSVVETLVKRLYREKVGGTPKPLRFSSAEELADETRWIEASDKIFTVKMSEEEWREFEKKHDDDWDRFWEDRMNQLYSPEKFGAIIINRKQPPAPDPSALDHPPAEVHVGKADWEPMAEVFWDAFFVENQTFSQLFDRTVGGRYKTKWEAIQNADSGVFRYATNKDDAASLYHYWLKIFIVKCLVEELWEHRPAFQAYNRLRDINHYDIKNHVATEVEVGGGGRADVKNKVDREVFEAETFFGENHNGIEEKLQQTVQKYNNMGGAVPVVNIVVDPITMILHLPEFVRFNHRYRLWQEENARIRFQTIDLKNEKLMPMGEVINRVKELETYLAD